MDLSQALNIWADKAFYKSADYHTYYSSIFNNMKRDLDTPLKDYIEAITTDPKEWIDSFPAKLCSFSGLGKPKSGMLSLLEHAKVIEALGSDYCANARKVLEDAWKEHGRAISDERSNQHTKILKINDNKKHQESDIPSEDDTDSDEDIDEKTTVKKPHYDDIVRDNTSLAARVKELENMVSVTNELQNTNKSLKKQNDAMHQSNEQLKTLVLRLAKKAYDNDDDRIEDYKLLLTRW